MTQTHSETTEPTVVESIRARRWKHVERAFTLAAMVVVVWLGWSTVAGMQRLFSPDVLTITTKQPVDPRSIVPLSMANLSAGGNWQMADWQWSVGVANVAAAEVDGRLDRLAECPLPEELSAEQRQAIGRLLTALHGLPIRRNELEDRIEYRFDGDSQKIRVLTAGADDDEVLVSLGAATRDRKSETWKLLELRSQPTRLTSRTPHLLPLPAASQRLCGRSDDRGRMLFEVIACPAPVSELAKQWTTAGWEVSPFFTERYSSGSFLCAKPGHLVHIWRIASPQRDDRGGDLHQFAMMRVSKNSTNSHADQHDRVTQ